MLTRITLRGARRNHAVVEDLVVERIRPAGRPVLVHRHRRVVREIRVVQHLVHLVAAHRQERSAHTADVVQLNATVCGQNLALPGHLACPLLLRELLAEAVTVWCYCDALE